MPEHDTFDLDAVFRAFEQDIVDITSPRDAGAAIATARRRRRTTWGAVAAVGILAVGGVVVGHGLGGDHAVGPAHEPPSPAPLTAGRLTTATAGWTPAWEANTPAAQRRMQQNVASDGCFPSSTGGVPDGYTVFGNDHDDLGITTTSDFTGDASGEPVVWGRLVSQMKGCAEEVSSFSDPASGVAGYTFGIRATGSESAPEYAWIVSTGQGIGVLKILGQSDSLPPANDVAMSEALVAAVEFRVSHSDPGTNAPSRQLSPESYAQFHSARLQHALGSWPSGWHDGPPSTGLLQLPCGNSAWNDAGQDNGIGTDGRFWIHEFSSPSRAAAGYQAIQDALGKCAGYTATTVSTTEGPSVFVARGHFDVWVVQHGKWVVETFLPRGATPPPDTVSAAMGSAMVGVVQDALASSAASRN